MVYFWKRTIDSLKDNNLNPSGVGVAIFATILYTDNGRRVTARIDQPNLYAS